MPIYDIIFALPYLFSDHPSFPEGLLKRTLESEGFSVGVIQQPHWHKADDFKQLGRPRLFFAVLPGPLDSIVLNYTSSGKRRREDLYQPKGDPYFPHSRQSVSSRIRPDRTVTVFSNRIREAFPGISIIIGGLEASMRKYAHYDFQQKKIRRSILLDSRADLLIYGMGEKQILLAAHAVDNGLALQEIRFPGTATISREYPVEAVVLPSAEEIIVKPELLLNAELQATAAATQNKPIAQPHGNRFVLVQPSAQYSIVELDQTYSLPFTQLHLYNEPLTPSLSMNLFSITSHRGCGGGCTFCSITAHEGRQIVSRSEENIFREIRSFSQHPNWRGVISDIGGASAEMYGSDCTKPCTRSSCLYPKICNSFTQSVRYRELLKSIRGLSEVKNVFIGSGIRFETLLSHPQLLEDILQFHSGRFLRVAPEHTESSILKLMRKPNFQLFEEFLALYRTINRKLKRRISLEPYYIIGYPGETDQDVQNMKKRLTANTLNSQDVQLFTPTPGTLATAMWVAEQDLDHNSIFVEKNIKKLEERKNILTGNSYLKKRQ